MAPFSGGGLQFHILDGQCLVICGQFPFVFFNSRDGITTISYIWVITSTTIVIAAAPITTARAVLSHFGLVR